MSFIVNVCYYDVPIFKLSVYIYNVYSLRRAFMYIATYKYLYNKSHHITSHHIRSWYRIEIAISCKSRQDLTDIRTQDHMNSVRHTHVHAIAILSVTSDS